MEGDAKRVVREWNREIDAEIHGEARRDEGPWNILVWVALEIVWLMTIFAVLALFSRVPW
ncbi:MAG: hypothetical protein JO139_03670 [Alphaproteobacteria bacterium]|jgi:hypothetical protein|nr:hypothetical protein [Alphaproteobacteria bacterium]MBV8333949.1 hypothetical protein [Alphaproteobacteria bacterium]